MSNYAFFRVLFVTATVIIFIPISYCVICFYRMKYHLHRIFNGTLIRLLFQLVFYV